jgi:hypothetical protein
VTLCFGGCRNANEFYVDYDVNTKDFNRYYVLSFDREKRWWYAFERVAKSDDAWFDTEEINLTKEQLAAMLEVMPVSALPVEVFI